MLNFKFLCNSQAEVKPYTQLKTRPASKLLLVVLTKNSTAAFTTKELTNKAGQTRQKLIFSQQLSSKIVKELPVGSRKTTSAMGYAASLCDALQHTGHTR